MSGLQRRFVWVPNLHPLTMISANDGCKFISDWDTRSEPPADAYVGQRATHPESIGIVIGPPSKFGIDS